MTARPITPVAEFEDAAALMAHYAKLRQRLWNPKAPEPKPKAPTPSEARAERKRQRALEKAEAQANAEVLAREQLAALVALVGEEPRSAGVAVRKRDLPDRRRIAVLYARARGFAWDDIAGKSRAPALAHARQDAMLFLQTVRPDLSPYEIGQIFGRDSTTVHHSLYKSRRRNEWRLNNRDDSANPVASI